MQNIIEPVDIKLIEQELTEDKFVRDTNNGNNKVYIITYQNSPNIMREIGRLREVTFRGAGGGTGNDIDIDEFDIMSNSYKQLIVWDPTEKEIVGGYRFIRCDECPVDEHGILRLATAELFKFSDRFVKEYMPYTIELGRSFVQPNYQPVKDPKKGMFALDNIWDGLGSIVINNPDIKYLFGKVTMYPQFHPEARDMLLYFLCKYFPDNENLVQPFEPLDIKTCFKKLDGIFTGGNYKEDYKILSQNVRNLGENIPPLVNTYMNLSPTMKTFGTALNKGFGDVEETGILVNIADIYEIKKDRHLSTYNKAL